MERAIILSISVAAIALSILVICLGHIAASEAFIQVGPPLGFIIAAAIYALAAAIATLLPIAFIRTWKIK